MGNELTLLRLKNTSFPKLYIKYMLDGQLPLHDMEKLLSVAVYLVNIKNVTLQHLGYRIIVSYCNNYKNYKPLYEIANFYGLYPVSKFIEDHYIADDEKTFFSAWNDASVEQYRHGSIYQTEEQRELENFYVEGKDANISVVAPTSYGKSELILESIKQYQGKKICIITSTKALLMQMKKRIVSSGIVSRKKIIVHPEMYSNKDNTCIAVLTQERFQRLLKKDAKLSFDCIIVDEAHELLENTNRSIILASTVIISKKRNPNVVFKFLTPFVADSDNLIPRYTQCSLNSFRVHEYIKTEKYYIYDLRAGKGKFFYDQFLGKSYRIDSYRLGNYEEEEVVRNASQKNIIYLNKPVDIEEFSLNLANQLPDIDSQVIDDACKNLSAYLQPQYNLIACLKKGVIYHHGSVPDVVRIFIEDLYKRLPEVKYIVTSSTLLAGVNLPAERIFILDNKKGRGNLRTDAFKNLIGRICRFSEIFDSKTGSLRMLEPEVHFIFGKYFSRNANYEKFLNTVARADLTLDDQLENVLLENTQITEENQNNFYSAQEFIENYENGTIADYQQRYTTTEIGKASIMNGIREIDVFQEETHMQDAVNEYHLHDGVIDTADSLMEAIQKIFINYIDNAGNNNVSRLHNDDACKFYSMMFDWRMGNKSYSEMIQLFVGYWRKLYQQNKDAYIYVGRWGNVDVNGSHNKQYTYLKNKNKTQIVNLAIVRIKEEQDFIDNNLIRFVEILHDLKMLDEKFYLKVKYGTDDETTICLLKNGLSLSLATLLLSKYRYLLKINIGESTVECDEDLPNRMKENKENSILIFEAKSCI